MNKRKYIQGMEKSKQETLEEQNTCKRGIKKNMDSFETQRTENIMLLPQPLIIILTKTIY